MSGSRLAFRTAGCSEGGTHQDEKINSELGAVCMLASQHRDPAARALTYANVGRV